jgi:hypothetical protein
MGCWAIGGPFYAGDTPLGWAKSMTMTMNDPIYRGVCVSYRPHCGPDATIHNGCFWPLHRILLPPISLD